MLHVFDQISKNCSLACSGQSVNTSQQELDKSHTLDDEHNIVLHHKAIQSSFQCLQRSTLSHWQVTALPCCTWHALLVCMF